MYRVCILAFVRRIKRHKNVECDPEREDDGFSFFVFNFSEFFFVHN